MAVVFLKHALPTSTRRITPSTFVINIASSTPPLERRGSAVVSTSACHAGGPGSRPGPGALLGVKTWLSTLEIVYLCVFRMRH